MGPLEKCWKTFGIVISTTSNMLETAVKLAVKQPHHEPIIKPGSIEEQIVADTVEDNVGFTGAMNLVNSHIKAVWIWMQSMSVGRR